MNPRFERTKNLIGEANLELLERSNIIIFGLGGVGSYTAEALCRCGIGRLTLVDGDTYSVSNLNRQLFATDPTVGEMKTEAAKKRLLSINPDCVIDTVNVFATPQNVPSLFNGDYTFCADAIDETDVKVAIALACKEKEIPLIAAMGTGNRIKSDGFTVTDIYKTQNCPLCRTMRKKYREAGIDRVNVVYSPAPTVTPETIIAPGEHGTRRPPASISYVPATAGLMLAEHIVNTILFGEQF